MGERAIILICASALAGLYGHWRYETGFELGVDTSLCVMSASLDDSLNKSCTDLTERQRNYAVRVGREIAERTAHDR